MIRPPVSFSAQNLRWASITLTTLIVAGYLPASSETLGDDDTAAIIAELQEIIREQDARLARLEAQIAQSRPHDASPVVQPMANPATTPNNLPLKPAQQGTSKLSINGDLRLRYEYNTSDGDARTDSRGVARGRVAAIYTANPTLEFGARLVTGDPDDPNSADVSLSNFNDDLQVSLDQIYARKVYGALTLTGGKFSNPFRRTDLVWDGDVNPQGIAGQYDFVGSETSTITGRALYFPIERSVAASDSTASGLQLTLDQQFGAGWSMGVATGYYDYEIEATDTANTGDTRTNRLDGAGAYVSDFDLLNLIASITYDGLGDRWPLQLQADYVQNIGADDFDTGYNVSAALGQSAETGDYRFSYGYHQAEADAVFAAFAQDNISYGSNYLQHAVTASYVLNDHLTLDAAFYAFRVKDIELLPLSTEDWQQRLRLNLIARF